MEAPYLTRVRVGSFLPPFYGLIPELYAHANATVTGYASAHAFPYNGAILLAMRRRRRAPLGASGIFGWPKELVASME